MGEVISSRRTTGMQARRRRILDAARATIAARGTDALNLRDLAQDAGVTVPTIYNLVGNKEEIFVALFSTILDEVNEQIVRARPSEPLALAEALAERVAALFATNEAYYRAAFLVIDHLHGMTTGRRLVRRLYRRGERLLGGGVAACAAAHFLRGRVPAERLVSLVSNSFNANLRNWAVGLRSIEQFRADALADLYITLAADAVETFQARLCAKLNALDLDRPFRRASNEA